MKPTTALVLALAASISVSGAANIAIEATLTAGNQGFGGSLGSDFVVNSPITVTQLGAFDHNGDGIVGGDIGAAIFELNDQGTPDPADDTGTLLVQASFSSGDPGVLSGSYRFKNISTVTLDPGNYTLVGWGYSASEMNGNDGNLGNFPTTVNDGGGLIQFVGTSRFGPDTAPGAFPTTPDGGPAVRYGAGNFTYDAVPEPSSIGLLGVSLFAFARRRRRQG